MPARSSNKERIARLAAEKAAEKEEKASKKKAASKKKKKTSRKKKSATKSAGRLKVVWVVCDHSGAPVQTFPYPEEKEARAAVEKLSKDKGKLHFVKKEKVPME